MKECNHSWNNVGVCSRCGTEKPKDHIHCWNDFDKEGKVICTVCGMKRRDYLRTTKHAVIVETYKGCIEKVIVHGVNMPFDVEEIRSDDEEKNGLETDN